MFDLGCTSNFFLIYKSIEDWTFESCSSSQFLPIHEKDEKTGFLNVSFGCTSRFFPITKELDN